MSALAQLRSLPSEALDALVSSLADVADAPWDAMAMYVREPEFRQASFGTFGLVSFYVDDTAEVIRVFDVIWTG